MAVFRGPSRARVQGVRRIDKIFQHQNVLFLNNFSYIMTKNIIQTINWL